LQEVETSMIAGQTSTPASYPPRRGGAAPRIERIDPEGLLSEDDAYALQLQGIDYRVARGDAVGLKTGLTSRAKQETMVASLSLGHLMARVWCPKAPRSLY
jgi:2-keto-4-pentenoate hydratase